MAVRYHLTCSKCDLDQMHDEGAFPEFIRESGTTRTICMEKT
jgi:hypothetical protein